MNKKHVRVPMKGDFGWGYYRPLKAFSGQYVWVKCPEPIREHPLDLRKVYVEQWILDLIDQCETNAELVTAIEMTLRITGQSEPLGALEAQARQRTMFEWRKSITDALFASEDST